jgi:hypothetical protein
MKSCQLRVQFLVIAIALPLLASLIENIISNNIVRVFASSASSRSPSSSNAVMLVLIHTIPSPVYAGSIFKINATVFNNSSNSVTLTSIGCKHPLAAIFEKNIEVINHGFCTVTEFYNITVAPEKSTTLSIGTIQNFDGEVQYKAISPGKTTFILQLSYSHGQANYIIKQPFIMNVLPK